ncbi:MAG TPA: hypothetical protein VNK04_03540 [Gemmataceae bacterium]|nr:hypothetical protein [Gemmataceae bacterium]
MRHALGMSGPYRAVLLVAVGLVCSGRPALGQYHPHGPTVPCPPVQPAPCPVPAPPPAPRPPTEKEKEPARPPEPRPEEPVAQPPVPEQPTLPTAAGAVGGAEATAFMLGNQVPLTGIAGIAFLSPEAEGRRAIIPIVRSFSIAENESPQPRDRVYFTFNYFSDINEDVNARLGNVIRNLHAFRYQFGFEKTVLNGTGSFGLRLPVNTLSADSDFELFRGTDTAVGDLTAILKYAPWYNRDTGDLLSVGLAVTAPTGPDAFAGSPAVVPLHSTVLLPYLGYILNAERWYIHGFSSVSAPTNSDDVTLLLNDVGIGYWLLRDRSGCRRLTAVIPTFEVHVGTPLNHRGALDFGDPAGTPDWVDLTGGITLEWAGTATFAVGFVTPVTGPKAYEWEVLAQVNVRFGRSRMAAAPAGLLGD